MNVDNPYAAPEAELTPFRVVTKHSELATRSSRFTAAILDGVIALAYGFPILYLTGTWNYMSRGQNPPVGLTIAGSVISFLMFVLVHGYFLKTNGQTVGKKLTGIRIADLDGNVPDVTKVILARYLPISVISLIPVVGMFFPLLDVLFIFRGDRRCIHDLIAGTKVVMVKNRG